MSHEDHVVIVSPVTDSLGSFKPLGWYTPGEASIRLHADGTVSYEGTVHWFDDRGEDASHE